MPPFSLASLSLWNLLEITLLLAQCAGSWWLTKGQTQVGFLKDVTLPVSSSQGTEEKWPSVSILIPARNEENTLLPALKTVLAMDYPPKQVIAINDRSVDNTENILAEAHEDSLETYPNFHVIQGQHLPEGWLGKPYALQQGLAYATGDWILLTDADVHFESESLKRAIVFCETHQLDHLAVFPELVLGGPLLNALYGTFWCLFSFFHQPWSSQNPHSPASIGVGAFNLVKRSALEKIGAFKCVANCPAEDMMLGKTLKQHGFRQQVLFGTDCVSVAWYGSGLTFLAGLRKNVFPMLNYNMLLVVGGILAILVGLVWPAMGVMVAPKHNFWFHQSVHLLQLMVLLEAYRLNTLWLKLPFKSGFGIPVAAACFAWVLFDSCFKTLKQGGIYWRGTFYPLSELQGKPRSTN